MDYKVVLTSIGIALGFVSYAFYFRGIYKGQTKPHAFSWLAWGLINSIVFVAQLDKGGGVGSWIVGFNALSCWLVGIVAIFRGEKNITISDWICFVGSLAGIVLWVLTKNPLTAVVLVSLSDFLAVLPTFRKSYHKPQEENALAFAIDWLKFVISLVAIKSFNPTTFLYPATVVLVDGALVIMILVRRRVQNFSK